MTAPLSPVSALGGNGLRHKVAASLSVTSRAEALADIELARRYVSLVEVRVDTLPGHEIIELVRGSPLPLIVTCRSEREGGTFAGTESDRLAILRAAAAAGACFVDIEWHAERALALPKSARTRRIVSRHFSDMPGSLLPYHAELRTRADAVKLVGTATTLSDVFPVLKLLAAARQPVVALAMGVPGQLTRLAAVTFPACLLTYGALSAARCTAPGQLTLEEMLVHHRLAEVRSGDPVSLHLCSDSAEQEARLQRSRRTGRAGLHVTAVASLQEAQRVRAVLQQCFPRWRVELQAGEGREDASGRGREASVTSEVQ